MEIFIKEVVVESELECIVEDKFKCGVFIGGKVINLFNN